MAEYEVKTKITKTLRLSTKEIVEKIKESLEPEWINAEIGIEYYYDRDPYDGFESKDFKGITLTVVENE